MKSAIILIVFLVCSSLAISPDDEIFEDDKDKSVVELKKEFDSHGYKCDGKNMSVTLEGLQADKDCKEKIYGNMKMEDYKKLTQEKKDEKYLKFELCGYKQLNFIDAEGRIGEEQKKKIKADMTKKFHKDQVEDIINLMTDCYMDLSDNLKNPLVFNEKDLKDTKNFLECSDNKIIEYCKIDMTKFEDKKTR